MKRKKLIAGNWKMNGTKQSATKLLDALQQQFNSNDKRDLLVCPPTTLLSMTTEKLKDSDILVGAQDCHFNQNGAHTGDISAAMLKDLGCDYVILGHSERRTDHKESNELIAQKATSAYEAGLKAIICIGETEAQKDEGKAVETNCEQIEKSVPQTATSENTVIAYEPVWAIGTGRIPSINDVEQIHTAIRNALTNKLGAVQAEKIQILYGGSMKPNNAKELLSTENVDGGLIGGASLVATDFIAIADSI